MSTRPVDAAVDYAALESDRIGVFLVSCEAPARLDLKRLLENEHDICVISATGDLENLTRNVRARRPDVVVLALTKRGMPTLTALSTLLGDAHDTRYVVMDIEQDAEREALPDAIRLARRYGTAGACTC